jgi:integrase
MPRQPVPLTDSKVRNAKPRPKEYKLYDGGGLYLLVSPRGGKYWRMKYRFGGKDKAPLAFGIYPDVSLVDAREKRDTARRQIAKGIDPSAILKAQRAAKVAEAEGSFEAVAREWYAAKSPTWSASHAETVIGRLKLDVFPRLGARPIGEINAPELLRMLRGIESRGALETAHRVRTICGQVFRYAIATGRADRDPAADLRDALRPYKKGHLAAITDPKALAPLLRAIDTYKGTHVVRCALKLTPMLLARPGELRQMEWAEIDFESATWTVPAEKMKAGQDHIVPLSEQAIAILRDLQELTGSGQYVFPCHGKPDQPMSEGAVPVALHKLGFKGKQTAHGFRATARTLLDEVLQQRPELAEHQLAHTVRGPLGRAYNRTTYLPDRRKMMQLWADYLDGLKQGAKVIPINRAPQDVR